MYGKIQEGTDEKEKRHIIRFGNCTDIIGGRSGGSSRKCNRYYCYTRILSRMNKSRKHRKKMRQMQLRFHRYRMKKNLQMLLGQKKKLHRHGKNIKLMVERSGG